MTICSSRSVASRRLKDRVTSARASRAFAHDAAAAGAEVTWVEVRGDTHAMLLRYRTWQRLAIRFALAGWR
jgi:hypothetical protein